ncbi:MAG TPA: tetratricopeptide repeat protein [Allosphingosinicella sp.]|nr:tetratricopeptide repeat protein [Allosphingosinicella sp.]
MRKAAAYSPLLLIGLALALPWAAAANPGGGGSSPPSTSAPSFDAAAEYRSGIEALKAERFAAAKKSFSRVLKVAPRDANLAFLLGLAHAGLKDYKGAAKQFERALKYDGKMIAAHQELGVAYARLGDRPKAEAKLASLKQQSDRCGAGCADSAKLQQAVAAVTAALGQGPQARVDTRPSLLFASAEGGDRAYVDAVSLINEARYEEAIASLHKSRAAFGAHPDVLTYLGFAHRKLGRFDVAESYYRQALAAAPEHKGATEYYGELMAERGDRAGAARMLARLEALCSFGCAEADELRRWIEAKSPSAS